MNLTRKGHADQPPAAPSSFPDIVRGCRDERGLTQAEFAELFDGLVSQQQVGYWELGRLRDLPRREALLRLAELCGRAPGQLLDALGYWGSAGADTRMPDDPLRRELVDATDGLSRRQVQTLIAVAREMGRS